MFSASTSFSVRLICAIGSSFCAQVPSTFTSLSSTFGRSKMSALTESAFSCAVAKSESATLAAVNMIFFMIFWLLNHVKGQQRVLHNYCLLFLGSITCPGSMGIISACRFENFLGTPLRQGKCIVPFLIIK